VSAAPSECHGYDFEVKKPVIRDATFRRRSSLVRPEGGKLRTPCPKTNDRSVTTVDAPWSRDRRRRNDGFPLARLAQAWQPTPRLGPLSPLRGSWQSLLSGTEQSILGQRPEADVAAVWDGGKAAVNNTASWSKPFRTGGGPDPHV
jgi:hypothetical protein